MIAVAGTATAIAMMYLKLAEFKEDPINNVIINRSDFAEFVKKIEGMNKSELNQLYPFLGKRIESIQGGAKVILEIVKVLNVNSLKFSTSGLRFGILIDKVLNNDSTH